MTLSLFRRPSPHGTTLARPLVKSKVLLAAGIPLPLLFLLLPVEAGRAPMPLVALLPGEDSTSYVQTVRYLTMKSHRFTLGWWQTTHAAFTFASVQQG